MSLDSQHMYKTLGVVALSYNPNVKEVEKAEAHLGRQSRQSMSPRFSEEPCCKKIEWRTIEDST